MATKKRTVRTTKSGKRSHHGDPALRRESRSKTIKEVNARKHKYAGSRKDRVRVGGDASARNAQAEKTIQALKNLDPKKKGVAVFIPEGGRPSKNLQLVGRRTKTGKDSYYIRKRVKGENGKWHWEMQRKLTQKEALPIAEGIRSGRAKRAVLGG